MHEIRYYETTEGNSPVKKFYDELISKHKDQALAIIRIYEKKLEEHGMQINQKFKPNAIKLIDDGIYELRPGDNRILFFSVVGDKFIFLHAFEKKTNKTPDKDKDIAKKRRKELKMRGVI